MTNQLQNLNILSSLSIKMEARNQRVVSTLKFLAPKAADKQACLIQLLVDSHNVSL